MRELSYLELLSSAPIFLSGIGHVTPLTIAQVLNLGHNDLGGSNYELYIHFLSIDLQKYFELAEMAAEFDALTDEEKSDVKIFDIWTEDMGCGPKPEEAVQNTASAMRSIIEEALSAFFAEKIHFERNSGRFVLCEPHSGKVIGFIDRDNFDDVRRIILQLNYSISGKTEAPKNKLVEKILAKLKLGAEKKRRAADQNLNMANMLSAFCIQSASYNMQNVWGLTVYQFYDQFFRLHFKTQVDSSIIRWAAHGTESYDFTVWYKSIQ